MNPKSEKKEYLAAFIPVIHRGYLNYLKKFKNIDTLYIFDTDLINSEKYLRKDIRTLRPIEVKKMISSMNIFKNVEILNINGLKLLDKPQNKFIFPDEDVSHQITKRYLNQAEYEYFPIFLRWDRRNINRVNKYSKYIKTTKQKDVVEIMLKALKIANSSSDIWRRVGAVLIDKKGHIACSSENRSEPSQFTPWIEGDTRIVSSAGADIEMNIFMHAEARLIAKAAKEGLSLKGFTLFVTTFPCPACSMLVAESGIRKMYFKDGYALLNGEEVLKQNKVELVRVIIKDQPTTHDAAWVLYPKKKL